MISFFENWMILVKSGFISLIDSYDEENSILKLWIRIKII